MYSIICLTYGGFRMRITWPLTHYPREISLDLVDMLLEFQQMTPSSFGVGRSNVKVTVIRKRGI